MAQAQASSATYTWEGTNKQGKIVRGEITASNFDAVKAELAQTGCHSQTRQNQEKRQITVRWRRQKNQDQRYRGIQPPAGHHAESRGTAGAGV